MLRLTLALDSALGEEHDRLIGTLEIVNTMDHPRRPEYGNYRAILRDGDKPAVRVRIRDWDRSRSAWELVEETLRAIREARERKERGPMPETPLGDFPFDTFKNMFGL